MNSLLVRIAPRFFKPSLAHSKRSIRLMALQRLDLQNPAQQERFLAWLQEETDPDVIQQALPLFPRLQPLLELLQSELKPCPEPLGSLLTRHLSQTLSSPNDLSDEHQTTLAKTTHQGLLLELISQADSLDLRLLALNQLTTSEDNWLEIALSNSLSKVRYQAASRIQGEKALEKLVKEAQGDKRVQRLARERLADLKAQEQRRLEALEQKQKLLQQLRQHLNSKDQQLFAARLEHLQRQWSLLEDFPADAQTESHYQELLLAAQQQAAELAAQEEAQRQREADKRACQKQQTELLQQLEEWATSTATQRIEQPQELQAQLQQLTENWQASNDLHPASASHKRQWQKLSEQLEQAFAAWEGFYTLCADLQILLAEDHWSDLQAQAGQRLLNKLDWPAALTAPEEVLALRERLAKQASEQQAPAQPDTTDFDENRCRNDLQQLETLLDEGSSRPAQRLLQQIQNQMEAAPAAFRQKHTPRLRKLTAQAAELKDWQGFVAAPKREALCEQMEALADDQSMEPQAKADRIQALQNEWRELGSAAINKSLWKRFKKAADLAYEPCKAWFSEQARQREYNQQQRQIICEELEALSQENSHKNLDEEGLDKLLTQVHDEWRRFNPVNRVEGKRLAERFQQALTPIKDYLYGLRQKHADRKRQLIAEAKALLDSEDLQAATATSKELQNLWRQVGRAPGSLEHQLWKEFRAACDQLFQQRDEQRQSQNQAREERFLQARQELSEARQALQWAAFKRQKALSVSSFFALNSSQENRKLAAGTTRLCRTAASHHPAKSTPGTTASTGNKLATTA
ncbi:DUF349 domain-containing protein [Marinospirillum sp.]|uniref:DUF349 domain-containing protein n=1 Tax=Marinospirillum sp. TaxID=2183934 RepID=UPI0028702E6B|nr:DUF349 domain-containing protein [Marinospirillum sp.]MDR9469007.1 DUF349 domain-containing protein [Marinospirillum sp.]